MAAPGRFAVRLTLRSGQGTAAEHGGRGTPVLAVTWDSPPSPLRQPELPPSPSANRGWCFMNPEPQQDSPINLLVLLIKHHIRKCKFPNGLPSISEVSSKSLLVMLSVPSQRSRAGGRGWHEAYWVWRGSQASHTGKGGQLQYWGVAQHTQPRDPEPAVCLLSRARRGLSPCP